MKYIRQLSTLTATGLGAVLVTGVTGCTQQTQEQAQAKGAFVIIEETAAGKYQIKDEFPADETRIVLKELNGNEKVLTQAEMDLLMQEENAKIDNGTSNLTNPQMQQQGGMGLGEVILASAAGAIIGSWIGSKLFGNQNYQNNRKASYKSPSTFSRSQNSFNKTKKHQVLKNQVSLVIKNQLQNQVGSSVVNLQKTTPLDTAYLESLGFVWHTDSDESSYISDELVTISQEEAHAYYEATNELYDMYVEAAEHVVENNLFHEIGIPFNLVDIIKESWENDVHWHLYGRFDLAGGLDGKPIKLLEFNADTPTALFETAIVQWAMLKQNEMEEESQFNALYESLVENFKRLVTLEEDVSTFEERYDGWNFLFTSVKGNSEEENTVRLLQHIASEAGFNTEFAYIDEIEFSAEEGIFYNDENYELWFKLIPWEDIALEESDLAMLLTNIIKNQKAIIFNPAYTLLFQSKGLLKILWDLYPNHPLLLESSFEPLKGQKQVSKPVFGREGGNVSILDENSSELESASGDYENHKMLYQAYTELATDSQGKSYQAGVFYAYEACGLGFRKGGKILDNMSKFVGHIVQN